MNCKYCDGELIEKEQIFKNGTKHIRLDCSQEHFNGYKEQEKQPGEFVIPFGKHKGKTIHDIKTQHRDYFNWCIDNMDNKIGEKFRKYKTGITND